MAAMLEYRTPKYNPYAVKYSPYFDNKIAVAAAANYGLIGNGRLYVLGLTADGIQAEKVYDTNDALYDAAWSEINENQVLVACADGSVKLFDATCDTYPVMNYDEHRKEVLSVVWSPTSKDTFASSSADGVIKIWSPTRNHSLYSLPIGVGTYSVCYSPNEGSILSAVSDDCYLRLFDLRTPSSAKYHQVLDIPVSAFPADRAPVDAQGVRHTALTRPPPNPVPFALLTHDWNKYRTTVIATGGVDGMIKTFDIRAPKMGFMTVMCGHKYAIRRLMWSPHMGNRLISASYDMTVRVWEDQPTVPFAAPGYDPCPAPDLPISVIAESGQMNRHTEFATGVDWSLFGQGGWVASAGWDERVLLWDTDMFFRR